MIGRFRKNKRLFKFYYLFMIPIIGIIWILCINDVFRADVAYLIMLTAYLLLFSLSFLVASASHPDLSVYINDHFGSLWVSLSCLEGLLGCQFTLFHIAVVCH